MRVVTACTACHRIGDRIGLPPSGDSAVRFVVGVGAAAVSGPEVGELLGLEDVTPPAPAAASHLLAHDPERVQEASEPTGALDPIPSRAGPEGLEQVSGCDRLAFPFADGV